jgi:hypothetical protein
MIKKGESVLIERVGNGFIVSPKETSSLTTKEDLHVFNDWADLEAWAKEHFEIQSISKLRIAK